MNTLVETFNALADETRLRIINLLTAAPELCVCDIVNVLREPQTKISRHLAYLRARNTVFAERKGKWMYYKLGFELQDNPDLMEAIRRILRNDMQFASDIELLLEGLDNNDITALQDASPAVIECVIRECCTV